MVHPDDAKRLGPLGVTANIQGLWAAPDTFAATRIGAERMQQGYPFRTIADGGADLAMGSDWPVSSTDPWLAIHVTVNRWTPQAPASEETSPSAGEASPDLDAERQALTLTQALSAYTSGSAELVLGRPGRIRVGERADIVVASQEPFELPAARIATLRTRQRSSAGQYGTDDDRDHSAVAPERKMVHVT